MVRKKSYLATIATGVVRVLRQFGKPIEWRFAGGGICEFALGMT